MIAVAAFFPRSGIKLVRWKEVYLRTWKVFCNCRHLDQIGSMKLPQMLSDSPDVYLFLLLHVFNTPHSSFCILFI